MRPSSPPAPRPVQGSEGHAESVALRDRSFTMMEWSWPDTRLPIGYPRPVASMGTGRDLTRWVLGTLLSVERRLPVALAPST